MALRTQVRTIERRLAQLSAAIDEEGVAVAGSRGQQRANPLLALERILQRDLARAHTELQTTLETIREHEMVAEMNRLTAWLPSSQKMSSAERSDFRETHT